MKRRMRVETVAAALAIMTLIAPGFAVAGGSGKTEYLYQDDVCNGMTHLTNLGRPCGYSDSPDSGSPSSTTNDSSFQAGYRKGYEDALKTCQGGTRNGGSNPGNGGNNNYQGGNNNYQGGNSSTGNATSGSVPNTNACVSTFYDKNMYNWLAIQNNCSYPIMVSVSYSNGPGAGSMHLKAGKHSSTGYNSREIAAKGSMDIASCPEGYLPTLPNDRYQVKTRYGQPFVCTKH